MKNSVPDKIKELVFYYSQTIEFSDYINAFCSLSVSVTKFLGIAWVILTQKELEMIFEAAKHWQSLAFADVYVDIEREWDFTSITSSNLEILDTRG